MRAIVMLSKSYSATAYLFPSRVERSKDRDEHDIVDTLMANQLQQQVQKQVFTLAFA